MELFGLTDKFKSITKDFEALSRLLSNDTSVATLQYPMDMGGKQVASIQFRSMAHSESEAGGQPIVLYAPPKHAVNDGAAYGSFDLGVLGSPEGADAALKAAASIGGGSDDKTAALKELKSVGLAAMGDGGILQVAAAAKAMGTGGGVVDKLADVYSVKKGEVFNPNTVMQFTNTAVRTYEFTFTMVAKSAAEYDQVDKIIKQFRSKMYPKRSEILLNYPDWWDISFHIGSASSGNSSSVNKYIPKPAPCFLTGMSTNYNGSGNMYHADGQPVDVHVALSFSETRTLHRDEIELLDKQSPITSTPKT